MPPCAGKLVSLHKVGKNNKFGDGRALAISVSMYIIRYRGLDLWLVRPGAVMVAFDPNTLAESRIPLTSHFAASKEGV